MSKIAKTATMLIMYLMLIPVFLYGTVFANGSDFDGNGVVDIGDFLLFVDQFGLSADEEGYDARFDLDRDGIIGISDFLIFVNNYGNVLIKPVCDRTPEVRDAILYALSLSATDCGNITGIELATIDTLDISNTGLLGLRKGDFDGLDSLVVLDISENMIPQFDNHVFSGAPLLKKLFASNNILRELPDSIFYGLDSLRVVDFRDNDSTFPFLFDISRVDTIPESDTSPATLRVSVPYPAPFDIKAHVFLRNKNYGGDSLLTIPRGSTHVDFVFDTLDSEETEQGWTSFARYGDERDYSAPYIALMKGRLPRIQNNYSNDPYQEDSRGFYGFTAVLDTLCVFGNECGDGWPNFGNVIRSSGTGGTGGSGGGSSSSGTSNTPPTPPPQQPTPTPPPLLVVTILDVNLRTVIEESLDKESGDPITNDEMSNLITLVAPNKKISDLTGLEFATDLTILYLDVNSISDISSLVANTGLSSGDFVDLRNNNSLSDMDINTLKVRGVSVLSDE